MFHDIFEYLSNLQTVGGVSGVIAVVIVITLCVGYLRDPAGNPGELGKALIYALTTIIGFYFGTAAGQKAEAAKPRAEITQPNLGSDAGPIALR